MANISKRMWGIIAVIVVLSLLAYLIFTMIFTWLFQVTSVGLPPPTATPAPTFTPTPSLTPPVIAANVTPTPEPSASATATPPPEPSPAPPTATPTATPPPSDTPTPDAPYIIAISTVNVREGPGTNYPILGQLPGSQPLPILGQNEAATWWQVALPGGGTGWVAASVVVANGSLDVPVAQAPPPPEPPAATAPPAPTAAPQPQFQFEPTGWYADTNYGLTRFLGTITDASGAPVNGVSVEAQCGDFRVISNPSGPVGWPPFYDSANDPPGFYDLTLDTRPIPCAWFLTVVDSPDGKTVTARMSDAIEVVTTVEESIITANWRKNW